METEKNNERKQGLNDNPEQVNIDAVKDITELDILKAENENLKKELQTANTSLNWNRKQYMEYMSQNEILKNTLREVCKRNKVSTAEMYEIMMTSNGLELDTVLAKLGKSI